MNGLTHLTHTIPPLYDADVPPGAGSYEFLPYMRNAQQFALRPLEICAAVRLVNALSSRTV